MISVFFFFFQLCQLFLKFFQSLVLCQTVNLQKIKIEKFLNVEKEDNNFFFFFFLDFSHMISTSLVGHMSEKKIIIQKKK